MRFNVEINDRVWAKVVKRFENRGILADTDAELFETMVATMIASENRGDEMVSGVSSTDVLITLGKVMVNQVQP